MESSVESSSVDIPPLSSRHHQPPPSLPHHVSASPFLTQQPNQPNNGPETSPIFNLKKIFDGFLPFIILALVKVGYDHRLGILIFFAMFGTFIYCNAKVQEVASPRHIVSVGLILFFNIFLLYLTFADQHLYKSLYFFLPSFPAVDLWTLLWIVGMNDFIIKFATIAIKLVIVCLPNRTICCRKKGQCYQLIEMASQSYRCLIPITPWFYFLFSNSENEGYILSTCLLIVYTICKSFDVYAKAKDLIKSISIFSNFQIYGSTPSAQQLAVYNNMCAVCHDAFVSPVQLPCGHIYCDECITSWLDRERTCPMCRSKMQDGPKWRDASTSGNLQLF
ncbi:hypothetical protein HELRODRAFT_67009 [Helobdella robusta]|uniref:RING-type domain-containing protein n=1 Tax=Helobdella robusta TaxID=6412 RepID=T1FYV1_HELRO|nr:hypothetical protein HELRODRAFT_67009 [Helobdella robusta]ESN98613.1 hypothetical protein HELRODRAFT_67009 [Helobdella robusta]